MSVRAAWFRVATLGLLVACGSGGRHGGDPAGPVADAEPSAGCRPGTLPAADGVAAVISAGSDSRRYLLDAPSAAGDRPLPVVVSFHGFRADAANLRFGDGLDALARRGEAIVVHPDGHDGVRLLNTVGRGWDIHPGETRDRDLVVALLDRLEAERCVDRRRVFATGMSNGGLFANLLGCALADRLAAIAPVAGAAALGDCRPSRPVPVLLVHGRSDQILAPDLARGARDWWARANGCGPGDTEDGCEHRRGCRADVVYCEGEHAHVWPPGATTRMWTFFTAHPRPPG